MAAAKRDYYEVLGVAKDADEATIKRAFKRLAIKYHPDHNKDPDAGDKFREINEAYQVLSDPQKRQAYDQFGFDGVNGQPGAGGNPFGAGAGGFEDIFGSGRFADIFGDMFGGGAGGGRSREAAREEASRGRDMQIRLTISLEEAVRGCKKQIKLRTLDACPDCHGTGGKDGKATFSDCPHCHGTGQITAAQGFFRISQPCPYCHGTGQVIDNPCPTCKGTGRVEATRTLNVNIPAGVDTGDRMRLQGEGQAGLNGAPSGDLYVVIEVREHEIFKRDGNDLYCDLPVSFTTAALGGKVEVPTLDGKLAVTIKPETQTGTIMRLSGRGVKSVNSMRGRGDLYCKVIVETPVNLTSEQKDLLRKFEASLNGEELDDPDKQEKVRSSHKPKSEGFINSVKKFFDNLSGK